MADVDFDDFEGVASLRPAAARAQRLINMTGAATSLALVIGLCVWSYNLATRDTTHIPVVRALEGPMRIAPEDPGGEVTAHMGLAVNDVAASGVAANPSDKLVLAPRAAELHADDAPGLASALPPPQPVTLQDTRLAALAPAPPPAVVEHAPLAEVVPDSLLPPRPETLPDAEALAALQPETAPTEPPAEAEVADPGNGLARSPRPQARPAAIVTTETPTDAPVTASYPQIDPATIAPGTRLVQLGAFDDASDARQAWEKLLAQFSELMAGKALVLETAKSGGRVFYRLRAQGFADEAEARRFCSALVAENAACIPVLTR